MAQTVETELIDSKETVRPQTEPERELSEQPQPGNRETLKRGPKVGIKRWFLLAAVLLAGGGAILWWLQSMNYESTDDAQIEGHLDLVSPRITGTVTYINPSVENNQFVAAGTLLLELDPRDYVAALEHAKADLDISVAEAHAAGVTVPIVNAGAFGQLHSAQAAKAGAEASVESEQANLLAA